MSVAAAQAREAPLVDAERLALWLDRNIPQLGSGPVTVEPLAGGATNAVFLISRGHDALVLRRPPRIVRPDSERIMAREARVLGALGGTGVPAPRLHGLCEDREVIGATFYVMTKIDGWQCFGDSPAPSEFQGGEPRRQLAFALVDALARLAQVDFEAVGLADYGKPDKFHERQVDRWLGQLHSYRELEKYVPRPLPGLDYVCDWLRANRPGDFAPGIMHGDYGFANVLFGRTQPARLAGIVDWELSTIGDPLLDLAWILASFRADEQDEAARSVAYFNPDEFPTRPELIAHYEQAGGRPVRHFAYFLVLAQFKRAVLLERHYARSLRGALDPKLGKRFADTVIALLNAAERTARANG